MGFLVLTNACTKALDQGEVESELKCQITSELHVNVELSCQPHAFVTSLLKFKLVYKKGVR